MFGLCIGLFPYLLSLWPSRSSVNICESINPGQNSFALWGPVPSTGRPVLGFLPCICNALFSCFVLVPSSLCAPKEQVSSCCFVYSTEPGQTTVSSASEVLGKWMNCDNLARTPFCAGILIVAEPTRCKWERIFIGVYHVCSKEKFLLSRCQKMSEFDDLPCLS